jgi:hypothetical protein
VAFAQTAGFDGAELQELELAVGEALANAVEHGHAPGGSIEISASCQNDVLVIEVKDYGRGFEAWENPAAIPRPASSPRGFGITSCVRSWTTSTFSRAEPAWSLPSEWLPAPSLPTSARRSRLAFLVRTKIDVDDIVASLADSTTTFVWLFCDMRATTVVTCLDRVLRFRLHLNRRVEQRIARLRAALSVQRDFGMDFLLHGFAKFEDGLDLILDTIGLFSLMLHGNALCSVTRRSSIPVARNPRNAWIFLVTLRH